MEAKELRNKSPQELEKIVEDLKAELIVLRFENATGQLTHWHKIKMIRRDIARIFTILNEKEFKNKELKNIKQKPLSKVPLQKDQISDKKVIEKKDISGAKHSKISTKISKQHQKEES